MHVIFLIMNLIDYETLIELILSYKIIHMTLFFSIYFLRVLVYNKCISESISRAKFILSQKWQNSKYILKSIYSKWHLYHQDINVILNKYQEFNKSSNQFKIHIKSNTMFEVAFIFKFYKITKLSKIWWF